MKSDLAGKVAIITGATSGIGHEAALLFASQGIKVIASGRNKQAGEELIREIKSRGGQALFVQTDLSDAHSAEKLVDAAEEKFGGLDLAFNCAGIEGVLGALIEMKEEDFDEVIAVNLKGVWRCMKAEIPALIKRGGGVVINVSTNITKLAVPTTSAYAASKAGVEALSLVAAAEYAKFGVRVNTIHPGAVDTPMLRRVYPKDAFEKLKQDNLLQKIATPKDVAHAALWLCSPLAGHVNAATLLVDGGESLSF